MLKKTTLLTLTSVILTFTGCMSGPKPIQKSMKNLSKSERTVIVNFNFPEKDPFTGKKISNEINSRCSKASFNANSFNFSGQIIKMSKYKKYGPTGKEITPNVPILNGLYVKMKQNNSYILNYLNQYMYSIYDVPETSVIFTLHYKQLNPNTISFTLDDKYILKQGKDKNGNVIPPLDKLKNLENDSKTILSKLKTLKAAIYLRYNLKGEINSKYKPDAVYANFRRLLSKFNQKSYNYCILETIPSDNTFGLKFHNGVYPLHIKVYPYRNGSKVKYEAYIPYAIYSDGTISLTEKDIENLKNRIENIVNN